MTKKTISTIVCTLVTATIAFVIVVAAYAILWLAGFKSGSLALDLVFYYGMAVLLIFSILLIRRKNKDWKSMLSVNRKSVVGYGVGLLIGAAIAGLVLLSESVSGAVIFSRNPEINLAAVIAVFIGVMIQGVSEEVLFRGYLFSSLREQMPTGWAVLLSSLVFGAMHITGGAWLWALNAFLIGVFFCECYLYRKSLFPISAMHTAFNFLFDGGKSLKCRLFAVEWAKPVPWIHSGTDNFFNNWFMTLLLLAVIAVCGVLLRKADTHAIESDAILSSEASENAKE